MTTTLKVTPESAKSKAVEMQTKANEIKQITDKVSEIVESLSGRVWSGEADSAYVGNYRILTADVAALVKMVEDNANNLEKIALAYGQREADETSRAGALDKSFL